MSLTKTPEPQELKRTLGPLMLWGIGVGEVISGMYFGWNLGLEKGGTLGLAIATVFITILFVAFTFSYTELACAIPKAGGAFDYTRKALGNDWAFVAGMAQIIEFVFAPPAIAAAIGAYFSQIFPVLDASGVAIMAYLIFTAFNIYGIRAAASFELIITLIAVAELLLFAGVSIPHVELKHLASNAFPHGWEGAFAAIPFALWFFLAIEGVANVAEETINPQRNIILGFGSAIVTLSLLCFLTFFSAVGVAGWEAIVYTPDGSTSDSPLTLALSTIVGNDHMFFDAFVLLGVFGLVASFHGTILSAGRATYELGKLNFIPSKLGVVHHRFRTPANALVFNMLVGIAALMTVETGSIIVLACLGALTLYVISMIALIVLRKQNPDMHRPFKVPFYPFTPIVALTIALISLSAVFFYNKTLFFVYLGIIGLTYLWYKVTVEAESPHDDF